MADRWHILSNLGDAVEEFLIRAHIRLEDAKAAPEKEHVPDKPLSSFSATPACQRKSQARLLRKWKLYQRIHELHATGMSLRMIGEELGISERHQSHRCPPRAPCVLASLIRMKIISSKDGAGGSATLPSFTAKSVRADIQAVCRWCEPM